MGSIPLFWVMAGDLPPLGTLGHALGTPSRVSTGISLIGHLRDLIPHPWSPMGWHPWSLLAGIGMWETKMS